MANRRKTGAVAEEEQPYAHIVAANPAVERTETANSAVPARSPSKALHAEQAEVMRNLEMGIVKRQTDTLEGEGTVAIGGQSYPTAYWLEVFQEFHETRTGGELPGVVDLEGSLTLIGANAPTSLSAGDAILTLDDGRQIGVVFSSLYNADRSFAFKLGNAMDFGFGEPK